MTWLKNLLNNFVLYFIEKFNLKSEIYTKEIKFHDHIIGLTLTKEGWKCFS